MSGCTDLSCTDSWGGGQPFASPRRIAVEASGELVVVDSVLQAVVRVHPVTGDRTIVSGCTRTGRDPSRGFLLVLEFFPGCAGNVIGRGQPFAFPVAIAVEANGQLLVADHLLQAVVRVDPITGDRTLLSR